MSYATQLVVVPTAADAFSGTISTHFVLSSGAPGPRLTTSSYVIGTSNEDSDKFYLSVNLATQKKKLGEVGFEDIGPQEAVDLLRSIIKEVVASFPYCNYIGYVRIFARGTTFDADTHMPIVKDIVVSNIPTTRDINVNHKESA